MATHFVMPQHPWMGRGSDFGPPASDAENIPRGQSKVVGSDRPSFLRHHASDPWRLPPSTDGSASEFSLFSVPPSLLLKKNSCLPPPPFSSFSYFSFSFLNEFIHESGQAPFTPLPQAKYTAGLNQAGGETPRTVQGHQQYPPQHRQPPLPPSSGQAFQELRPPPLRQVSSFTRGTAAAHFAGGAREVNVGAGAPGVIGGLGTATTPALLPLPQQPHPQSAPLISHHQQHQRPQQPAGLYYLPQQSQSPPFLLAGANPQQQPLPLPPQSVQGTSLHALPPQPQPSAQRERRGSYSDGECDTSGSDSDGCGLPDSPQAKAAFKNFVRQFKRKEKECGMEAARDFAVEQMASLPTSVHWRVCLELADFLKRENAASQARRWYAKVVQLQPAASQGWLEYAKLEEECGRLTKCRDILLEGLTHCPYSESLLVKALKHEERMGNLPGARSLLSRLRDESVERTWKTVLEGGLLEARAGNLQIAREVFKYLIKHVPWYGPIFNEAFRLEERHENHRRAAVLVERGLEENPRYGPLWFSALRVQERLAYEQLSGDLSALRCAVKRALACVPKELVWKIHFEHAQVEERAGLLQRCRREYVRSAYSCPQNLIWKVWLGGARTELSVGNTKAARKLLQRALGAAPRKMRAAVLLECSRLEEYSGHTEAARLILRKARKETKHEWRVFLESVLVEIRANNVAEAIRQAEDALRTHTGTGRLWAVLIHLHWLRRDEKAQLRVFKEALQEVPKSGEVWCEGARIAMRRGNKADARRFLQFAIQFTPQYGDSFVEYLRLELIEKGPSADTHTLEQMCINADPNYGFIWLQCKNNALDGPRRVLVNAREMLLGQGTPSPLSLPRGGRTPGGSVRHCQRQVPSGYVFLNSNTEAWPVNAKQYQQPQRLCDTTMQACREPLNPLHRELTCLTPLSHCPSAGEKWKIIFGGDPIKP